MSRRREEPQRPPAPLPDALPEAPGSVRPEVPAPPPAGRSRARLAALLIGLLVVGVASGFGVAMLLGRGPCHGAGFVSDSFAYCVEPPDGWVASPASEGERGTDVFRSQDGTTEIAVVAVASENATLQTFAEGLREAASLQGYALGDAVRGSLDGSPTLEWDTRVSLEAREIVIREIVVIREGVAWRLQVADVEGTSADGVEEAARLLDSWRFA